MDSRAQSILDHLQLVESLRRERAADAALAQRVLAIKRFQQRRFERTYADLLASQRYAGAARFFLDELYGPADFSQRDAQFARVVPGLVRLFPSGVVQTVDTLGHLHALSETLDTRMARALASDAGSSALIPVGDYANAWRSVGEPAWRQQQVDLTLQVGEQLDRFTRNRMLRHSLRLMRGPAHAAGLEQLQKFLEAGFDTFAGMNGAADFLRTVRQREEALASDLFADRDASILGLMAIESGRPE